MRKMPSARIMLEQFGIGVLTMLRPTYRKPYPEWIDRAYLFPRNYFLTEFSTFSGTDNQPTIEHFGRFTVQCRDVDDFVKMRLLGNSLTRVAFSWYTNLPPLYRIGQQLEKLFPSFILQG